MQPVRLRSEPLSLLLRWVGVGLASVVQCLRVNQYDTGVSCERGSDRKVCVRVQWGEAHLTLARASTELGEYQHALRSYDRCAVRPLLLQAYRGSSSQGRVTCTEL